MPFLLATMFWATGPTAVKLGTPHKGYGMSLQVQRKSMPVGASDFVLKLPKIPARILQSSQVFVGPQSAT